MGLVDTSVVISFLRGDDSVAGTFKGLLRNDRVMLSTITVFELRLGEITEQKITLNSLFEIVKISDFDSSVANLAAKLYNDLEDRGDRIGLRDTFIAATALNEGLPVYTLNTKHFDRIESLSVLDPTTG